MKFTKHAISAIVLAVVISSCGGSSSESSETTLPPSGTTKPTLAKSALEDVIPFETWEANYQGQFTGSSIEDRGMRFREWGREQLPEYGEPNDAVVAVDSVCAIYKGAWSTPENNAAELARISAWWTDEVGHPALRRSQSYLLVTTAIKIWCPEMLPSFIEDYPGAK